MFVIDTRQKDTDIMMRIYHFKIVKGDANNSKLECKNIYFALI